MIGTPPPRNCQPGVDVRHSCRFLFSGDKRPQDADRRNRDDALDRAVRSIRSFRDVDALYDRVPGSYITAVAFNGSTRVHGTLAATHEIFYADVDGIVVAANKASILARIAERAIRREMLATTLLAPRAPWPLSDRPLWKGVEHVPVTDALELHPDGRGVIVPRWSYPAHREPLTDIAPRLRVALEAGVRARADATPVLGSDLSGGLDSTTLAFYADRHAQRLVTVRQDAYDATNDDVKWAALARSRMGTGDHIRMEPDVAPWYAEWNSTSDGDPSSPYPALRTLGFTRALAERLHDRGVTIHLTGLGGDELFSPSFTHLYSLVRRHPLRAFRPMRGMQAIARWKTARTIRALTRRMPHSVWLRDMAGQLRQPDSNGPEQYWEPEARAPSWATAAAVSQSGELIREAADLLGEESPDTLPVDFEMLRLVNADGRLIRRMSQVAERHGVAFDAPYLDDAVVDLAFRTRLEDRVSHGVFKPVLQAAVPENFPHELLSRRSKGDYSAEAYSGLARNRGSMVREFAEGSLLQEEGLIDAEAFREFLTAVHPSTQPFRFLDATLGAEMWLRSVHNVKG
jgi:asparagine synthase